MRKSKLLGIGNSLLTIMLTVNICSAQNLIAVQNGNAQTFYTSLDTAITHAQNSDTIYLPGGSFTISTPITKSIHLVGVGHHPDSTLATNRTIINGIQLETGSDNGSLTGVYINGGSINFNSDVNGYRIIRCYLTGGIFNGGNSYIQNIIIQENVIGSYDVCFTCSNPYSINISSPGQYITNNIILSKVQANNSNIKNNVFLFENGFAFYPYSLYSNACYVENNIFKSFSNSANHGSVFNNNVNGGVNGIDSYSNQGFNNFFDGIVLDSIFMNFNSSGWSYSSDLHLRAGSIYHNSATDGTDIGIYGGVLSWKEGSIPSNPHIQSKNIPANTNSSGNLPINIKVAAQDH